MAVVAVAIVAAGLMSASGPAVAQDAPRGGALVSFRAFFERSDGRVIFEIRGAPKDPNDVKAPFVSTGTMSISRKTFCVGAYRGALVFTTIKGRETSIPYTLRLRGGRLDGVAKRCPLAGLPARGLKSLDVRVTIDRNRLVSFVARPSTRTGDPLDRLDVPELSFFRSNTPPGLLHVQARAQYRSGGSHTVEVEAPLTRR
jgi:hypothetical protein